MPAPESIKELIRKVHALAQQGIGGEAEAAKNKLQLLLAKHNTTIEAVLGETLVLFEYTYKDLSERKIIMQCYASLGIGIDEVYNLRKNGRKRKNVIGIKLTTAQGIDLTGMIDYYLPAYRKEQERLFMAFIHKHELFPPTPITNGDKQTMSMDDILAMRQMMHGLGEETYQPQRRIAA